MPREKVFKVTASALVSLHNVVACRAMDVNVNEARRDGAIVERHEINTGWQLHTATTLQPHNGSVFHDQHGAGDRRCRCVKRFGSECNHRSHLPNWTS